MKLYADYYAQLAAFADDFRRRYLGPFHASFPPETYAHVDQRRLPAWLTPHADFTSVVDSPLAVYLEGGAERVSVRELGVSRPHYVPSLKPSDVRVMSNEPSTVELLEESCL